MTYDALKVTALLLCGALGGCLTDPQLKPAFQGFEPTLLPDGWQVSTPELEGLDPARIHEVYELLFSEERLPTIRSLLVVRHGKLVAEGYSRDPRDRDRVQELQSATKSITSLLVGIARAEGLIGSLDTPLYELLPEHFDEESAKRTITLRHVLTMKAGLEFDNREDVATFIYSPGSSVAQVLHRPLRFEPGSTFYYTDGTPQLAAGALMAAGGGTLEEYARHRLFGPMGIQDIRWEKHGDGLSFGAFGLWLRPRDMAKIGQLMLQGGTWEGRRVVPSEWIEESTRVHANGDYGYYWWINEEGRVYRASGDGSQIIFVHEPADLVIVLTGDPAARDWILSRGVDELFVGILEAIVAS